MDIKRLRLLRAFADHGSVGAVAEFMGITPSAVSQQLKILATEAGVALFEPDGRGIRLTAAGTALVLRADEVIAAADRAMEKMKSYQNESPGVRLAISSSAARALLPGLLTGIREYASMRLFARELRTDDVEDAAALTDNDIVVTHRDGHARMLAPSPRVTVTELMREPLVVVASLDSTMADRHTVNISDLADAPLICDRSDDMTNRVLMSITSATGVSPCISVQLADVAAIELMVAAGHGVALLPRSAARHPRTKRLELEGVDSTLVYEAITRSQPLEHVVDVVRCLTEIGAAVTQNC
ncbi:hypothetical protein CH298_26700 [Rhodococcoides fascians]|uniref:LysR family transcriptional regulator n=1 Tax=Rhodococcoides fascians TaxID=1828 RepID=UPI000B9A2173|nr:MULTISPECIES: LysR family transcriptional regulator [Rhodococcus]OZD68957.1 hypothetical protein CH263_08715 [Rhodococcus sp. 06-1059B-a]OZE81361.1 hypothetical protein CH303_27240 [Rhodococcus fascians]OZF10185.1 hypothetical protein CH298_26700 [Rhodococcus fascians]OZF13276.1 hypothetical protein CH297_26995 [Rhodococcus fascians]OZF59373.1 hypothetical protein CH308_27440 [Rhodococcus fascians]